MSEETQVQHRFVQIYALTAEETEKVWTVLAQPSLSPIAVSNACNKLISSVQRGKLNLVQTMVNIQTLVLTSSELKLDIFLRTLSELILIYVDEKNEPFVISKTSAGVVQPFITLLRQAPQLYNSILLEVDHLIPTLNTIDSLVPFFDFVLFAGNVDSSALLTRLTRLVLIPDDSKTQLVESIFYYLLNVTLQYPTQQKLDVYFNIVDTLLTTLRFSLVLQVEQDEDKLDSFANDIFYQLVHRALNAADQNKAVIGYLNRIQHLLSIKDLCTDKLLFDPNFNITWACFSYLLLKAQTFDDQTLILQLMVRFTRDKIPLKHILWVAYLPLFQTLSELLDSASEAKSNVLTLISFLDGATHTNLNGVDDEIKEIEQVADDYHLSGITAHVCQFIIQLLKSRFPSELESASQDVSYSLSILFTTPFTKQEGDVQHKALVHLSHIVSLPGRPCYKFPVLLYSLYLLRQYSQAPKTLLHLLYSTLPSLVQANDPTTTSKVLSIALSIINGASQNGTMASVGVTMLAIIYQHQPRVWQELKKVLTDWILRRKSRTFRRRIDLSETGTIKLELAVLTTMRDLCKTRPRECAPDILPMVMSLLQTCQDLSMASLSVLVETISHCTESGLVEPRSIWTIAVRYIADFAMNNGIRQSKLVIKQLCKFFGIAGKNEDGSEIYMQFKQVLLSDYIQPLLNASNTVNETRSYALMALSQFPAGDIQTVLPEKSGDYLDEVLEINNPNYVPVLAKLMTHELDHMRRGLFKQEGQSKVTEDVVKTTLGEREHEMGHQLVELWESARVAPGLRSGYANAVLHTNEMKREPGVQDISKTKWYRSMVTCFTDIALTDHLLVRVSSLGGWKAFFNSVFLGDNQDVETKMDNLLNDLISRLERSTVPGTTCNILLAITGLINTIQMMMPSFAFTCANRLIELLMKNYVTLASSPLSHSAHLMSEEVQFAAHFALGHIATCVISNESLTKTVLDTLLDPENSKKFRNIDTAVDLVQFAKGYAAGHFTATMASWPTKTAELDALAKKGMYKLLENCNKPAHEISESRALGIMMGWASEINSQDIQEVYWFGKEMLTGYLEGAAINRGLLFGATWVCAKGALSESGALDQETLQLLESVIAQATADASLAQHYYHFSVPFAQLSHSQFVHSHEVENSPIFKALCATYLDYIEKDDQSSHYRIASIFSLGSIFNVNYLSSMYDSEQLVIAAQKYSPIARKLVLDKLMFVAGLTGNRSPVGNLKSGRIAASVCGQIIEATLNLQSSLENEQNHLSNAEHKLMLASASSEPKTLARLNKNTSYIRAVFDRLEIQSDEELLALLNMLIATPGPLPAVNWFHSMQQVSAVSEALYKKCLEFASLHASTSLSLTEFLLSQLSSSLDPQKSNHKVDSFIVGETGLGWMLDLAGLTRENAAKNTRRGMSSVTKKTSISDIRLLEMMELYVTRLPNLKLEDQKTFLTTLALHLPEPKSELDEAKAKIVDAIRIVILKKYIPTLFERDVRDVEVIQKAVECGITDIEQLFENDSMENWLVDHLFAKTVMLSEIHRLKRANQPLKWMTETITRLISQKEKADDCWPIIARVIGEDAAVASDKLSWIIRVLDAFIVVGTTYKEAHAMIEYSLGTGLYSILSVLWWQAVPSSGQMVEKADSCYMLSHVIDMAKGTTMQQQIIKRVYKMIELATETRLYFTSVIRQCQALSATAESNYVDVITS